MEEREKLLQQRQNWLKERNVEIKMKEFGLQDMDSSNNNKQNGKILTELTMKLTEKLEKEMQSKTQTKKDNHQIEQVLTKEIESNTCPICYELMVPPTNSPILLFPCGHTFCKQCVYQQKTRITKCPFCRKQITSSAVNISLQNLICAFTDNKHLINKYNEIEETKINQPEQESNDDFQNNLKMFQLRCKILEQEKAEIMQINQQLKNDISSNQKAIGVLQKDKKQLISQIEKLNKELNLIETYIQETSDDIQKTQNKMDQNNEKVEIIENTLIPIKQQRDKYLLLIKAKK